MAKTNSEQPKKKRQSGRRKTKAELAAIEKAKQSTQEEPKRSMEDLLNGTAVIGVVQDGGLVLDPDLIDMSKATIFVDRNHPDAEMASDVFVRQGSHVILEDRPKFENPVVTEGAMPDIDPHFQENLPAVEYIYPFDPMHDSNNPLFAANLLAERQDALLKEKRYSADQERKLLDLEIELAGLYHDTKPDPNAGLSQTEIYERRAVEFYRNTIRKTRSRLSKAQVAELQEIYNFLMSDNIHLGSCDLCACRCYAKIEKYLQKKKLI